MRLYLQALSMRARICGRVVCNNWLASCSPFSAKKLARALIAADEIKPNLGPKTCGRFVSSHLTIEN